MDELRARLRRVEEDAAAARILAGGADRDVSEIRTELREFRTEMHSFRDQNNRVLSAMREDLTDFRADLTDLRVGLNGVREHMDRNFLMVHSKIDGVAAGLQVITDLLTRRDDEDGRPSS